MRDPWGISGPTFIWIYAAAVVLPMIVSIVWGRRQARAVNAPAYGFQYTQLPSPYHLAYLAGSGDRAVEAAVAGLVEGEQLRVDSRGVLSPTGTPVRDPLEQQVMSAVIAKPGAARAATVKSDLKKSSVVKELRGYLERAGLIVPLAPTRSRNLTIMMLYLLVLGVGIWRLVNGIKLERPVGWLWFLVILCAVFFLFAWLFYGTAGEPPERTPAGNKALADAMLASKASKVSKSGYVPVAAGMFAGAAALVAIGGLASYPDPSLAAAMNATLPGSGSGGGSSCSGSSCSGGSSCGGGGGCGG